MAIFPFTLAEFFTNEDESSTATVLLDHVVDVVSRAKTRMLEQYKGLPNIEAFTTIYAERLQGVEDALWQIYELRSLSTATGIQLDVLGKIVSLARQSLGDEDYRSCLRAQVKLLKASGTTEQLYAILGLALPDATLAIADAYPAGFTVLISGVAVGAGFAGLLASFIRRGRMGGVRAITEYTGSTESDTFRWDTTGQGWDQGHWADAIES